MYLIKYLFPSQTFLVNNFGLNLYPNNVLSLAQLRS